MQTKRQTLVEVLTNTFTGMLGSWLICYLVISHVQDVASAATLSTVGCTVWSLARGWVIRRTFNKIK